MKASLVVATLIVVLLSCASTFGTITIDMVPVGNSGNAPDTRYDSRGVGSVGYTYQIGKYEITTGQYTEFLNAAAKDDPNGLYNTHMGTSYGAIVRTGTSPNYGYSVAADWANRPAVYVTFWDAARFANWLHNGQPTGAQGPGTTEGGAYHDVGNDKMFGRNPGAKFFIPTDDEWYKAAYHKNDSPTGNYWDYPTASNTEPINTLPDPGNHANFFNYTSSTIDGPYYRTQVGEFVNSPSPYGTFDQGGNAMEWTETPPISGPFHFLRGGSWDYSANAMRPTFLPYFYSTDEYYWVGFRMASIIIPEPSSVVLTVSVCAAALWMPSFGRLTTRRSRRVGRAGPSNRSRSRGESNVRFQRFVKAS